MLPNPFIDTSFLAYVPTGGSSRPPAALASSTPAGLVPLAGTFPRSFYSASRSISLPVQFAPGDDYAELREKVALGLLGQGGGRRVRRLRRPTAMRW